MERFSITTGTKDVHNALLKRISAEVGEEVAVDIDNNAIKVISENNDTRDKIIRVISDTIVEKYENKFLNKLINQNYFYFNLPDKRNILKKAMDYTDEEKIYSNLINTRLNEYLSTTDKLALDGFVNFRLKDYQSELEEVIDKAVDDFMIEKEYKEFIKLLKYFVDIQNPRYELVNIVPVGSGYIMYDENGTDITADCAREFMREIENERINSDDLLISSLISIAPRRICIHKLDDIENVDLLNTIEQVFSKKITKCNDCDMCQRH